MVVNARWIDGPTPANGAYAIAYVHDDGTIELVEFDDNNRVIRRTYGPPEPPR